MHAGKSIDSVNHENSAADLHIGGFAATEIHRHWFLELDEGAELGAVV